MSERTAQELINYWNGVLRKAYQERRAKDATAILSGLIVHSNDRRLFQEFHLPQGADPDSIITVMPREQLIQVVQQLFFDFVPKDVPPEIYEVYVVRQKDLSVFRRPLAEWLSDSRGHGTLRS